VQGGADGCCLPLGLHNRERGQYCGASEMGADSRLPAALHAQRPGGPARMAYARQGPLLAAYEDLYRGVRDEYCGDIGDGCGSTLTAEPRARRRVTCQDNLCKAGRAPAACAGLHNRTGDQYCGEIGNGCGFTLHWRNHVHEGRVDLPRQSMQGGRAPAARR